MRIAKNGATSYFFLILTSVLSACAKKEPTPPDTLIIGIESEVRNLDLRSTFDANSTYVISLFSQSLVRPDENLLPITDLATSFKTPDNKTYTFTLPSNAHFHDGSVLDCDDVLESFKQCASPTSRMKSNFDQVKEFRCLDPLTFVVELKVPLSRFLLSEVSAVRILPKEISLMKGPAAPIGSGPYRFVKRTYRDLIFERFDGFQQFQNGQRVALPAYKKIIVRTLSDPSIRWLSINSGDIDALMNALSPLRIAEAKKDPSVQVFESPGTTFQYLAINMKNPKFRDLRVRQALAAAIDRDSIIQHKLFGMAVKANSVLTPVNFFHDAELSDLVFDPKKSRKLLEETHNLGLEVEIKTSTDPDSVAIIQVIAQQLREAGFDPKVRSYEFGTFFGDITKGNYEIYSLRWTAITDPDFLQRIFHSREVPPGRNRVFYSNPQVDRLLESAGREGNVKKRQNLYNQVQKIILADLPYVPLWYPENIAVLGASIKGFRPHPTGSWESLLKSHKE